VQVQEKVGEHHHNAIAAVDRHRVPEDALPDLRFANGVA
jgi:hypothetical protein